MRLGSWCVVVTLLTACGAEPQPNLEVRPLGYRDGAGRACVPEIAPIQIPEVAVREDLVGCFTVHGDRLGVDTAAVIGGVNFSLTRWVEKTAASGEYIGFTLTTDGGLVYVVESGTGVFRGSTLTWRTKTAMIGASTEAISLVALCPIDRTPEVPPVERDEGTLERHLVGTPGEGAPAAAQHDGEMEGRTPTADEPLEICDAVGCCAP